ncbi:MAG: ATP-binding cassette domain-containing protein [Anaerolineae bacterium]|nr:ATP-binding cassette domain-containing protein [Anaerolineae bacterium]
MLNRFRNRDKTHGQSDGRIASSPLIHLQQVVKTYPTPTGDFYALKTLDLQVNQGEFVAVIGKSGSGKTTLINMLTGIDKPTAGEIVIGGKPIHHLGEGAVAAWRGLNVGVVFQFFQLLPTLTNVENVMLPMDFCNTFRSNRERQERALHLLDLVEIKEHAFKKPSEISGGQQQRVAIARALANDPPILVADEPTGNLDSKTANAIFDLFGKLVAQGKTIFMVTHDKDLAQRVTRTIILSDGEIIDEYLAAAFPMMDEAHLREATRQLQPQLFKPGEVILHEGEPPEKFYIVSQGAVEVLLREPDGSQIVMARLRPGQYFGEIALLRGGARIATVIADPGHEHTEVLTLDKAAFLKLMDLSPESREETDRVAGERARETEGKRPSVS